jgi:hypothetical protein
MDIEFEIDLSLHFAISFFKIYSHIHLSFVSQTYVFMLLISLPEFFLILFIELVFFLFFVLFSLPQLFRRRENRVESSFGRERDKGELFICLFCFCDGFKTKRKQDERGGIYS